MANFSFLIQPVHGTTSSALPSQLQPVEDCFGLPYPLLGNPGKELFPMRHEKTQIWNGWYFKPLTKNRDFNELPLGNDLDKFLPQAAFLLVGIEFRSEVASTG